ncbi:Serine--pyruvate aminotransferase, mitochondrial [Orchesella cincta]|uniref:Alanine--glyoxylate aminotransferase n=1 Tax=Orchesella cincta TaxID=48709 RepID=A0A1D2MDT9_ORCCI|nr:Serine--pyruvate aminotransferase, mitochondrial [Orchesella cincta]
MLSEGQSSVEYHLRSPKDVNSTSLGSLESPTSSPEPFENESIRKPLPVPKCLSNRAATGEKGMLAGGGACTPYPRSFEAMKLACPGMYYTYAKTIRKEIMEGLRYILQTKNQYTFAYHGSGSTGTTAVMDNLIEQGDKVAVGVYGHWSSIAADIAERLGANVIRLKKPLGSRLTLEEIEKALSEHKPKVLYLLHGESTTGILQPLDGIGEACEKYGTILAVDLVSTVAQIPIEMDRMKIDVVMMNTQKAIGGVVGLAPVSYSPKAIAIIRNRKTPPRVYQTDVLEQAREWLIEEPKWYQVESCLHSVSLALLHMLREGLANIVDEGIENVWARHDQSSRYIFDRAEEMGLEFVVPVKEDRLPGTLLVKCPKGKDAYKVTGYMWDKHRIELSTGFGPPTIGKCIRVGLFGENARLDVAETIMDALKDSLSSPETNA